MTAVPGIGPKTFEQAAGFLRIRNGDHALDVTAVHPESYPVVEQIAKSLNVPIEQLIEHPALLEQLDRSGLAAGVYTLNDILEELRKPGRDPRDKFLAPTFKDDVKDIGDLQAGMTLEGVVTNVTKFGAFVDVGVHQDGLVHISELSDRYIKEPADVVKVGQIVKVHVLSADAKTKRVALSMKTPGAKPAQGTPLLQKKPAPRPSRSPPWTTNLLRWRTAGRNDETRLPAFLNPRQPLPPPPDLPPPGPPARQRQIVMLPSALRAHPHSPARGESSTAPLPVAPPPRPASPSWERANPHRAISPTLATALKSRLCPKSKPIKYICVYSR